MNHSHWNYLPTRSFEGDDTGVEMMRPEADEAMNTLTADVAAAGRAKTRGKMVGLWGFHPETWETWWFYGIWSKKNGETSWFDANLMMIMMIWNVERVWKSEIHLKLTGILLELMVHLSDMILNDWSDFGFTFIDLNDEVLKDGIDRECRIIC